MSRFIAAKPTAWKVKNEWTKAHVKQFMAFSIEEFKRIVAKAKSDVIPNRLNSFDCADLIVTIYIRYAAKNGLPVTFTSKFNKEHTYNPSDEIYVSKYDYHPVTGIEMPDKFDTKEFSTEPDEAIAQFIEAVREHTSARSLVNNKDLIEINVEDVLIDGQLQTPVYQNNDTHTFQLTGKVDISSGYAEYISATFTTNHTKKAFEYGIWMGDIDYNRIKWDDVLNWSGGSYIFKEIYNVIFAKRVSTDFKSKTVEDIKLFENINPNRSEGN